jgi:hypothetical protein
MIHYPEAVVSFGLRLAHLPVLVPYFCYGASAVTAVALVFFEKNALKLTPADAASIAFWLGLPWSMKMVAGVASDAWPIAGSRRGAYLLLGCAASLAGYLAMATVVESRGAYLAAMVLVTVGFMIQDVVADALSVEVARDDKELAQLQAWGRIALLVGGITVSYLGGVLAERVGLRVTFGVACLLPIVAAVSTAFIRPARQVDASASVASDTRKQRMILAGGFAYALFGVGLRLSGVRFAEEMILVVSAIVLSALLRGIGMSRPIVVAAIAIFAFRATPDVGQGYSFWAIDKLRFDERFLGLLAQISSVLSVVGLLLFRKPIATRPVSFTLFWVTVAGTILYLPNIGLVYGLNEWLGISPRVFAVIDTTITAPLAQLAMVPMLVLIARSAQPGAEATTFALMASLMNLALSTSQLFTRYLNEAFAVTQADYSNLGPLMITVAAIALLPLLLIPMLRRTEQETGTPIPGAMAPPPEQVAVRTASTPGATPGPHA